MAKYVTIVIVAALAAGVLLVGIGGVVYVYLNPPSVPAEVVADPPGPEAPAGNTGTDTLGDTVVIVEVEIKLDDTSPVSSTVDTSMDTDEIARNSILVIGHTDAKIQEVAREMDCAVEQFVKVSDLSALAQFPPGNVVHLIHAQLNQSGGAVDLYFRAADWKVVDDLLVEGILVPWSPPDSIVTPRETFLDWAAD